MDVADLVLQIKRQYGDEYGVVITDPDILQYIYEGELDILRNAGGNETKTTPTAISAFPLTVPSTIQIIRVTLSDKALTFVSLQELDLLKAAVTTTQGVPQYWYQPNDPAATIDLYPKTPGDTTQVTVFYKKTPVKLTTATGNLTVPERYHTDLLQYCLARAHNKNRDSQSEQIAMQVYQQNVSMRREEEFSYDGPIYKQADPADYGDF